MRSAPRSCVTDDQLCVSAQPGDLAFVTLSSPAGQHCSAEELVQRVYAPLAELLREMGVEPPMKVSIRTGRDAYAFSKTDEEFKALLEHENPLVQAVVAARLADRGVLMPAAPAGQSTVTFGVNETWTRTTAAELTRAFEQALA